MLTLPSIDLELKQQQGGDENAIQIVDTFSMCDSIHKQIEQVGSAYEKLKVRIHKQKERHQNHAHTHLNGVVSDSGSDSSQEEEEEVKGDHKEDWEKKRKKRTKEEIEKECLLMGDLYAILGIDHLSYEAGEGDIKSAYKKLALMYHPDKIGENITASDKEVWLQV